MGYIAALFIGISLGLIGAGGSILTVPVLVYLFNIPPVTATSYSLFIVGTTSLIGSVNSFRKQLVDIRTTLLFGVTSVATVFIIRKFLIHNIPQIIKLGNHSIQYDHITMILFAVLMMAASVSMISSKTTDDYNISPKKNIIILLLYGIAVGLVTGFLGAGGGFLLIPFFVLILHLPIKKAIGSSLLIIALNALVGFTGDIGHVAINWAFLFTITIIAVAGVVTGGLLQRKIDGNKLKKGFGVFVLIMGIYIIIHEVFIK